MEVGGRHAPAALPSEVSPGVICTEGWMVHSVVLDECGKENISFPPPGLEPIHSFCNIYFNSVLLLTPRYLKLSFPCRFFLSFHIILLYTNLVANSW
jgi:hypothetical protein